MRTIGGIASPLLSGKPISRQQQGFLPDYAGLVKKEGPGNRKNRRPENIRPDRLPGDPADRLSLKEICRQGLGFRQAHKGTPPMGETLVQKGDQSEADPVAKVGRIGVGGIDSVGNLLPGKVTEHISAAQIQQGPEYQPTPPGHSRKPPGTGPPEDPHQEGLQKIIPGMGNQNRSRPDP
jgi:hypothetical protein